LKGQEEESIRRRRHDDRGQWTENLSMVGRDCEKKAGGNGQQNRKRGIWDKEAALDGGM